MTGKALCSILREYGFVWMADRGLYCIKIKLLNLLPATEALFEKKTAYPVRIDLFDIDTASIKTFLKNLPEQDKEELLKTADKTCKGRITGFSSLEMNYGYPVEWQLNPMTGKKCDGKRKWFQIPDFDKERGDIKAVWEISRFSHFIVLSRAYMLTKNTKYYEAFSEQLKDWLEKNPYSYGANFKCGQECALRMVNALFAYTVFENCGLATEVDRQNIKELIARCYRKILSNFFYAYRCIKNNHTISELLGMITGAWCCEDKKRLSHAFEMLEQVIDEQFTEDGGYTQYSFNYERLALQDLEVVLAVEKTVGFALSKRAKRKLLRATELMYQCQDESGDMPNYGSNDGALVFPLTSCDYRNFCPVINSVYTLLTGKKLYAEGKHEEELLWLGIKNTDKVKQNPIKRSSHVFEGAGLYTIRNGKSWLMIILNKYHSRPAHMDQLHIDLWIQGINVLCDGGTFSYADESGKKLIRNESHNTVVCGDRSQMNAAGAFMVYDWTDRKAVDYSQDSFCGVMQSKNGYSHKRQVKVRADRYEVLDFVKGESGTNYEVRFFTTCDIREESNQVKLLHNGQIICIIKPHADFQIQEHFRSLYYLKKEKNHCIVITGVVGKDKNGVMTEIITKGD